MDNLSPEELSNKHKFLKSFIKQKEKELDELESEINDLKQEKQEIKKKINSLKVSYNTDYIIGILPLNETLKQYINRANQIKIFNKDCLKTHNLSIKYTYNNTKYHFHISRRPDEFYNQYSVFINGKLTIHDIYFPEQFEEFDYHNLDDTDYFSNYIMKLSNKPELYLGFCFACYYFLMEAIKYNFNLNEYNKIKYKNDNIKKVFNIIKTYKEKCDYSWYSDNDE
ncbi:hypothetical protein QKU48_gp0972 [Fadolivirus algeromassiliense]|jgi:hypothetical protein|uniref:Uncharacterized protein n=1 Tax=Fadolivirus FV1/VV64 TaxID=3070911 RepID=A0A7D3UTM4_9VIRU|nr:hypothetical protein QKU48_gp0972 [Fadolivirus algeromassiliense]QKF94430.1 hypothetical protein Fadolivirus_1_972 [Fadolivirus FV1/VV64]